jgi:hypothetical protein
MFITKEEEKALGISEHNTINWRRQNNISDTDGVELLYHFDHKFSHKSQVTLN